MDIVEFSEFKLKQNGRHEGVTRRLDDSGYCLVVGLGGQSKAISLMQSLGCFIKQYNGSIEHDVTYKPGFDDKAYSQSINMIRAHTEAPGWSPSPKFLALYCKRQALCGGGHTNLLDYEDIISDLNANEVKILESESIFFPGPEGGIKTPMLIKSLRILRFSYNLLTCGEYDPIVNKAVDDDRLPLGVAGVSLAHNITRLFDEKRTSILIPDDGLLIWNNLITMAQDMGLTVIERPIAPAELRSASEIMLAGTAIEWVSVGTLDGQILDKTYAIFLEIRARFDLAIEGSLSCREAWAEVMF
ncbi:hypothetical protein [Pseudomonas sp. MPC6]|uniref:hypothetical protein n=1 Tax=unclassified Pseudomonas TaxID=196821 RepID=UPI0011108CFD|nr:hypothetical protein [Pseudomonas sp. MPC6]QCY11808.1 hypothetical protein ELQ88_13970 [Pseudomonas sp. MPC6]